MSFFKGDTSGTDLGIICRKINPEFIPRAQNGIMWHLHIHQIDIFEFSRDAEVRESVWHGLLGAGSCQGTLKFTGKVTQCMNHLLNLFQ